MALSAFVNVFLHSIGFSAQRVGIISAINSGVGIFASPFWGILGDKLGSLKKVIVIALIVGSVFFALIPGASRLNNGLIILFILIPFAMFFRQPTLLLLDNWMLRNSALENLNYGALRSFGAISYAIASFAMGYVLPLTGISFTFYATAVFSIPLVLMLLATKSSADEQGLGTKRSTFKEMKIGQLFKNYFLVSYFVFSIIQRIPMQLGITFLPFLVADIGGNTAQIGIIMGLRAAVEIPIMIFLKPLRQRIPLYCLIMAASFFYMLECLFFSFAGSFSMVVAISIFHGLGNGLMLPSGSSYVFQLAPEHLKATAQTFIGAINSIAGIVGGILGGLLLVMIGIKTFYLVIGIMMFSALCIFIISFIVGNKVFKLKAPGLSLR